MSTIAGTYSKIKTVITGETITASDRNAEHDNHITNADPSGHGSNIANAAALQAVSDPYAGATEVLPTDLETRLQQICYVIKQITGKTQWYFDAAAPGSKGSDVASAGALTLGTDGNFFDITGTTAITSIGTLGIGSLVRLQFDGALTLTHHATDLILPSGQNIITKAGDIFSFIEYASGDWLCVGANRPMDTKLSDVASASALPVLGPGFMDVTGTTTVTSIDSIGIGSVIILQFDGALTLTHNATDLILPGGANLATAAGDVATFVEYASGDWLCTNFTRAAGSRFGAWASGTFGSAALAATDGFVSAITANGGGTLTIKTDSANPPTTIRNGSDSAAAGSGQACICPVRKGDYYLVECGTASTVYWLPLLGA